MIPLRDTIRSRTAPVVTVALIIVNVLVFLHEIALGPYVERFVHAYGLIPRRLVYWPGDPLDPLRFLPLLTSMFWHGGWLHLISNMLYLWIFGDNVEDRLGHLRFLLFYVAAGAAAGLTHVALSPASALPTVARVLTLIPIVIIPWFVEIPAFVYLVLWFVMQLLEGVGSLGAPVETGGVAVWAHIGGFVAGVVLMKLMQPPRRRPQPLEVRP